MELPWSRGACGQHRDGCAVIHKRQIRKIPSDQFDFIGPPEHPRPDEGAEIRNETGARGVLRSGSAHLPHGAVDSPALAARDCGDELPIGVVDFELQLPDDMALLQIVRNRREFRQRAAIEVAVAAPAGLRDSRNRQAGPLEIATSGSRVWREAPQSAVVRM
jgi:hypothetical protein